jgi:hypothetical protein
MNQEELDDLEGVILSGLSDNDVAGVRRLLTKHPEYKDGIDEDDSWLTDAAGEGQIEMVKMLLDLGADVNRATWKGSRTALSGAIHNGHLDMARLLLSRGADPNLGRPLIGGINVEPEELALEFVKLLVEHGADVNRVFPWFGDWDVTFTPLEWAETNEKKAIAAYLRSKGAVPREPKPATASGPKSLSEQIVAYFAEHFGPVQAQALIEIVPEGPPIAIHVIPPAEDRKHLTLFTTGMSEQPMTVPEGSEDFRFGELYIQLPAPWPLTKKALAKDEHAWPIHWLRWIAKYPHLEETWLGGPATIIANGDPPQPLAPRLPFTSLLLLVDRHLVSADGRTIHFYRLMPLYTEERALEMAEGIGALLRAFDQFSVPFIVDLARPNVALEEDRERLDGPDES